MLGKIVLTALETSSFVCGNAATGNSSCVERTAEVGKLFDLRTH